MHKSLSLSVTRVTSDSLALTNCVYLNPEDAAYFTAPERVTGLPLRTYMTLKEFVFVFQPLKEVMKGEVALSSMQRNQCNVALNERVSAEAWIPMERTAPLYLQSVRLEIDTLTKNVKADIELPRLQELLLRQFVNHCLTLDQKLVMDNSGVNLVLRVAQLNVVDAVTLTGAVTAATNAAQRPPSAVKSPAAGGPSGAAAQPQRSRGVLMKQTEISFAKAAGSAVKLVGEGGAASGAGVMFRPDWNFESMGIGGLDREFSEIFRRAFASRIFPPAVIQKMGINYVRGLLLHGPPGTGKTLMARQIGKMLNGKEPKVVSGPEILSKYVGESEANIRKLFLDAENEYKTKGDESDLHIIIFDEIDALCRSRGTRNDGTGVGDTVVNQILTKIDGVDALNNILVIGMTNRKDMIDEALLRPGRLEVHMEINLPDEAGRLQILRIHTAKMAANGFLDPSVNLVEISRCTKNFSGAELEGLVRSASSFALNRQVNPQNLTKQIDPNKIKVARDDFSCALAEVKPAFGASRDEFEQYRRNGLIPYGPRWDKLVTTATLYISQCLTSSRNSLVSLLLEGLPGSGKTALAVSLALLREIPFVKMVSPDDLIGYGESQKCTRIHKVFDDAYKSPLSCVVVDDIERLLEYVPIGPRFSNSVLQTLLVLLKKQPPAGHRLLVIGTTSVVQVMQDMEVLDAFTGTLRVPLVEQPDELKRIIAELDKSFSARDLDDIAQNYSQPLPIKRLVTLLEMTKQAHAAGQSGAARSLSELFVQNIHDAGLAHAVRTTAL